MWSSQKRLVVCRMVPRGYCAYTNLLMFRVKASQLPTWGSKLASLHEDYASWLSTRKVGFPLEYQTLRAPNWSRNWQVSHLWFLNPGCVNDSSMILDCKWWHRKRMIVLEGVHGGRSFCLSLWHGLNPGKRYLSSLLLTWCMMLAPSQTSELPYIQTFSFGHLQMP